MSDTIAQLFDQKVMRKYNTAGPRYTSYPTAVAFEDMQDEGLLAHALKTLSRSEDAEKLSLYMHIPFCHSLCYYCGCNKIVTRHAHKADIYLDFLIKEIRQQGSKAQGCMVNSVHLGGGTPSFLSIEQMKRLVDATREVFAFAQKVEMSIEIDPREIELSYINQLAELGFTRLSIGVQDIDTQVQKAINRVQSTVFIRQLIERARECGFTSINVDLIYGLPLQTQKSFQRTLDEMQFMNPDRISLFSYAHMPQLFASQRKIKNACMPTPNEKFALFRQAISELSRQGYDFIGMDHFALPSDELSKAKAEKRLYRNFQGYTTSQANSTLGLGVSAISSIGKLYTQNHKQLKDYYRAIDAKQTPLAKGVQLSDDDTIRRALIHSLMCNFHVDKTQFSSLYGIDFDEYFADSLDNLSPFIEDNLVSNTARKISIHERGRLIVRNICMSFDQYLNEPLHQTRYSRVI
ncbi:oxygen-independent coproporphyrinogen III oxidase [Glaciecola siphonariae]|uniref:Coproporphyrinogen-III oxidase n=1 Tax=Glaciecola siphonariae TaxID=521012 RepID=A0ABV9LSW6_9ALTE